MMSNSTPTTFAWRVWRISNGKAHIEKVVVAKRTKTYVWAVSAGHENTAYAMSTKNKFAVATGCGNYSQEPCCERLFFTEQEAFNYAIELNKNRKPYYHGDRYS
jgi:hypothetical protein